MDAKEGLKDEMMGQYLTSPSIICPAVIVDRAVIKRNCLRMLDAVDTLGVGFRVHVKTHKTIEATRLQLGDMSTTNASTTKKIDRTGRNEPEGGGKTDNEKSTTRSAARPANIIVSTVREAEHLSPYLRELVQEQKRPVSLLYGVPPNTSCFVRLRKVSMDTGCQLAFLIDHPDQLSHITDTSATATSSSVSSSELRGTASGIIAVQNDRAAQELQRRIGIWIKIDTGYHRAGVLSTSQQFKDILAAITLLERDKVDQFALDGFYSHLGSSYAGNSPDDALSSLALELERGVEAIDRAMQLQPPFEQRRKLTLSVGATPTVAGIQNIVTNRNKLSEAGARALKRIEETQQRYNVELHAGVYPFLDLQQLATHARPTSSEDGGICENDIGIRILAEVLSVYEHDRHGSVGAAVGKSEVLIGAGCLALGREPCKSYPGWGVLAPSPWSTKVGAQGGARQVCYDEYRRTGWIVNRISQEHGILTWEGNQEELIPLKVGEKVMIWPNHACIAAACFDQLIVVDESVENGCVVVDVWQRCRGW